jgi:hypothetical protein
MDTALPTVYALRGKRKKRKKEKKKFYYPSNTRKMPKNSNS